MALTGRQTLLAIVITYVGLLLIFKLIPPMTVTSSQTLFGTVTTVLALSMLLISALMKFDKLKPGSWWGRSATASFWQGISFLIIGLGNLSHLVVSSDLAFKLREAGLWIGALTFFIAILILRRRAKPAGEL